MHRKSIKRVDAEDYKVLLPHKRFLIIPAISYTSSLVKSLCPIRSESLSKQVRDLLQEFESQINIADDFQLHVLKVSVDESGAVEQTGNAQPVTRIEIDSQSKECLLHFAESTSQYVTVSDAKSVLVNAILDFEVCAAQEQENDEATIRLDTPLIGFGENVELKVYFVICQA